MHTRPNTIREYLMRNTHISTRSEFPVIVSFRDNNGVLEAKKSFIKDEIELINDFRELDKVATGLDKLEQIICCASGTPGHLFYELNKKIYKEKPGLLKPNLDKFKLYVLEDEKYSEHPLRVFIESLDSEDSINLLTGFKEQYKETGIVEGVTFRTGEAFKFYGHDTEESTKSKIEEIRNLLKIKRN